MHVVRQPASATPCHVTHASHFPFVVDCTCACKVSRVLLEIKHITHLNREQVAPFGGVPLKSCANKQLLAASLLLLA